ncbi:MAG: CRISPR-associated helicase Cas3' [Candidatus Nanoarchaeia archaeon]|jgi:CRISPR-associated endonuclease/helicase Cas3|nr:CRISPR-associated helicase Cas3' [Candidatus Nanoarchaeia archaeon]
MLGNNCSKRTFAIIPLNECLAKTWKTSETIIEKGSSVFVHCYLTGLVAKELITRFPKRIQENFFPKGTVLVVASHDIGKVEPRFQVEIYSKIKTKEFPDGQKLDLNNIKIDKFYHNEVSQAEFLKENQRWANIVGRHHGYSTTSMLSDAVKYGGLPWHNLRQELLKQLKQTLGDMYPIINTSIQEEMISGLTCVSDWIASSETFSDVKEETLKDFEKIERRIKLAVDKAGFINSEINNNLSFKEIFGFDQNEVQKRLIQVADRPGVYVLEAPMGIGKTAAALYVAYLFLQKNFASGVYFALPTQLTSNKIYEKMNEFLDKILKQNSHKSLLLHSNAWLFKTELGGDANVGESWFDNRKRGLLAPFSVGTLDQALMSVLNVKHNFVRTFGLGLNKLVIIDEVHTYDSYTGTLINFLINILEELGCTVIILSATLTKNRKYNILNSPLDSNTKNDYPVITSKKYDTKNVEEHYIDLNKDKIVKIKLSQEEECIHEAISRAIEGQQVLWIENTVSESQRIFRRVNIIIKEAKHNIECGLVHSRFLKKHRIINEEKWTEIYGKKSEHRNKHGRILIGTQVLEQSLDLDSDFLISRYAPIDMLLQRIGRLWRHEELWEKTKEHVRPKNARREVYIMVPHQTLPLKKEDFGDTSSIYPRYVLSRTLEILMSIESEEIIIPSQIPELIEQTYLDRVEQGDLLKYKNELNEVVKKLRNLAWNAEAKAGITLPDHEASTRYGETESMPVLVLKKLIHNKDFSKHLIFLDDTELMLPTDISKLKRKEIKEKTAIILKNTVVVTSYNAPSVKKNQMKWLKGYVYLGEDDEKEPFSVVIRKENGELVGPGNERAQDKDIFYNNELGYVIEKNKKDTLAIF